MKIAIFLEAYLPYTNGVVTHVSMLRDSFTRLGHKILIVTADPKYKRHHLRDGVLYCPAAELHRLYGYGLALPNSRTRDRIIREFAPDVIHVHQEFGVSLFGMRYAKKHRIPVVYTLHTMYDDYFSYVAPGKMAENIVRDIFCTYMRYFVNHADVVMSPSEKAIHFLHDNGICGKEIIILPNAIDTGKFDPDHYDAATVTGKRNELGISDGNFCGVFVGRLGYEKSIDYLIEFWHKYLSDKPRMKLLIIGDGPERENLTSLVGKYGLSDVVKFAGRVDHDDIPLYLAACDYFISASLTEMMSISMLEAISAGRFALLRFDETNASQIEVGVNGFIYKNEDELNALLDRVSTMSEEEMKALRSSARDTMLRHNSDSAAEDILNIYKKCISEKEKNAK